MFNSCLVKMLLWRFNSNPYRPSGPSG